MCVCMVGQTGVITQFGAGEWKEGERGEGGSGVGGREGAIWVRAQTRGHAQHCLTVSQGEGSWGGRWLINLPAHLHHSPHAKASCLRSRRCIPPCIPSPHGHTPATLASYAHYVWVGVGSQLSLMTVKSSAHTLSRFITCYYSKHDSQSSTYCVGLTCMRTLPSMCLQGLLQVECHNRWLVIQAIAGMSWPACETMQPQLHTYGSILS